MIRTFIFFIISLPFAALAQVTITGRVINQADTKPVVNASVFLSNATIGDRTATDGAFTLRNIKPGKYDLVVSIVGFETYNQTITVGNNNIVLPDIAIFPKTIALTEVTVKYRADPNREKYLYMFRDEFLGTSELAKACKILNPKVLDLSFDDAAKTLTASTVDFLEIENDALGYKIKYLVTDFSLENNGINEKKIFYKGPVLFEEMKGTAGEERRWKKGRQEVYENSPMHFLRSALNNRLDEEGFRVQKVGSFDNPNRPPDSLINARIKFYKQAKITNTYLNDPLGDWIAKSKLPKKLQQTTTLHAKDFIKTTDQPDIYALVGDTSKLFVAYNKTHHFHIKSSVDYLYNRNNTENTLIKFNSPNAFFGSNGIIINPYSVVYYGVWGRNRVAELLPINYEPPQAADITDNILAENITAKLDTFSVHHITEKAYLHFDKPYYAAGDTIYFKAYLTQGENHSPSSLSGVLHVDLINTNNKIDQSIKLQLGNGVAWGDFALPDSLPKGNYRVRAYTRWMLNEGGSRYFYQNIPVGSALHDKTPESTTAHKSTVNDNPEIQFFPEGGNLIIGIRSKVAYKALNTNGLGIDVKGVVVDNENKEAGTFASQHLGMGYFYINPQEGKTYKARVSYSNGTQDVFDLPKPEAQGIILSVNNDSLSKATVKIQAGKATYLQNRNKNYTLVIYAGGEAATVNCKLDSPAVTLDILKRRLRSGIARLTLFSPTGEPLNERLLFIQNHDQLHLDVSSSKTSYAARGKTSIKLKAVNQAGETVNGHFSVSVTDEGKVPVEENTENTILTSLLLTSDLKGYVEQPNYYFSDTSISGRVNLDLLMLTQGYRRFEWKQLLSAGYPANAYPSEKGLEIAGVAKSIGGRPLANGTVSLISSTGGPVLSQQTDDKGTFRFSNLVFMDTTHFVLNAINANGKNNTQLVYIKDSLLVVPAYNSVLNIQDVNIGMRPYIENRKKQQAQTEKYGPPKGILLKEVKIREKKRDDNYRTANLNGPGHADQVIHRSEFRGGGLFSDQFNGILRGVSFGACPDGKMAFLTLNLSMATGMNGATPMVLIIDGAVIDQTRFNINNINVNSIETIEVLKDANAAIYGIGSTGGVLVITTRQGAGLEAKDIVSTGILPITSMGFYKAREFYAPKYDHDNPKRPDLRSTIYWDPEIITDKEGNASFEYYNADGKGSYRVVIEGIDEKGNLGRQVYRYKVE
jgi:CarboxypepD_reg-like domain/TonB-dependent Receptor Plug Domain